MSLLGEIQMTQGSKSAVYGVEKPETCNLLGRHAALLAIIALGGTAEGRIFLREDLDQAAGHRHKRFARAEANHRRDELRVKDEVARSVTQQASDWQKLVIIVLFTFEQESDIFPSEANGFLVRSGNLIEDGMLLGQKARAIRAGAGLEGAV